MPFATPIPPSPDASSAVLDAFVEHGIEWVPDRMVTGLDPDAGVVQCGDGSSIPYDLCLGIPVHRTPSVVTDWSWPSTAGSRSTRLPSRPVFPMSMRWAM